MIVLSWELYVKENDNELCIELDLGMVFGIGDYLMISMCLKVIEIFVKLIDLVIDVGIGLGILSIVSYLFGV